MLQTVPLRVHLQKPVCTGDANIFLGKIYGKGRMRPDKCVPVRSLVLLGLAAVNLSLHEIMTKSWGQRRLGIKTLGDTGGNVPHLTTAETLPPPKPQTISSGSGSTQREWWQSTVVGVRSRRHKGQRMGRW